MDLLLFLLHFLLEPFNTSILLLCLRLSDALVALLLNCLLPQIVEFLFKIFNFCSFLPQKLSVIFVLLFVISDKFINSFLFVFESPVLFFESIFNEVHLGLERIPLALHFSLCAFNDHVLFFLGSLFKSNDFGSGFFSDSRNGVPAFSIRLVNLRLQLLILFYQYVVLMSNHFLLLIEVVDLLLEDFVFHL